MGTCTGLRDTQRMTPAQDDQRFLVTFEFLINNQFLV